MCCFPLNHMLANLEANDDESEDSLRHGDLVQKAGKTYQSIYDSISQHHASTVFLQCAMTRRWVEVILGSSEELLHKMSQLPSEPRYQLSLSASLSSEPVWLGTSPERSKGFRLNLRVYIVYTVYIFDIL